MISETQHVLSEREVESYLEEARLHDALSEYSQISVRAEAYVPELKEEGSRIWPIQVLDPWNSASYRGAVATLADKSGSAKLRKEYPKSYDLTRQFVEDRKPHTLNAWQLRETHQHLIPVSVHKDAKCNIPDIGETKYHVSGDKPLGAFVKFIRTYIRDFDAGQPISVSFKNTKPASETLMSKIDAENKDEDGFLHMTYTGEQKEVVGAARSDIIPCRVRRKTTANRLLQGVT
ncbi:uncharacterized protein [Malus domestica]|uniref:uncharacterized protein n=1 Tax=Malus domestica TaxID=3750 RepID=UPI003976B45D